jgi:dTDP-4-dehydrorhamnose reductase
MGNLFMDSSLSDSIPGLEIYDLNLHVDNRGWFRESWKVGAEFGNSGVNFKPVQSNLSFNLRTGTIRGIHAEPWEKLVTVATGRVFAFFIDFREGRHFGKRFSMEIDQNIAVLIPKGVGNSFQTLEDNTTYTYLVSGLWNERTRYLAVNPFDSTLDIPWPIEQSKSIVSDKDAASPSLSEITPIKNRFLVLGATGQLGIEFSRLLSNVHLSSRATFDILDFSSWENLDLSGYDVVINAAAFTNVDRAETDHAEAWLLNANFIDWLAQETAKYSIILVHFSTDYVFDGTNAQPVSENHFPNPLNYYGVTKAAGDMALYQNPRHYALRISWLVGEGNNFVTKIIDKAKLGHEISVVTDQIGRLTFANDVARAVVHLLEVGAPYGKYNFSNSGRATTWHEVAKIIYKSFGADENRVSPIKTDDLPAGQARRPLNSMLDLEKMQATGFAITSWEVLLNEYLARKQ